MSRADKNQLQYSDCPTLFKRRCGGREPIFIVKKSIVLLMLFSFSARSQTVITFAGNGSGTYGGDGGEAILAGIKKPNSMAIDKSGSMFIVESGTCRIRKMDKYGFISTIAGNGICGYDGDNGPATNAQLDGPVSIAIDTLGGIYFSTAGDHRIIKISASGIITTIAGDGTFGYNGDSIPATSAKLFYPYLGVVDHYGNLYFSDYDNHRIRKIDTAGIITTIAGNGTNSSSGDNGPATAAALAGPAWITMTASGEFYIPDNSSNNIRKISSSGIITTIAGTGMLGNTGDGGPATNATFILPNSVAVDNSGNVFVADYGAYVIRKIDSSGIITTIAGTDTPGYSGDGCPAITAEFTSPNVIAFNANGNLFISDINMKRIREIIYHPERITNQNSIQNSIAIFPNPAKNEITIIASDEITDVTIVNVIGWAIIRNPYNKKQVQIDISDLPTGLYFIRANGIYTGKFVKE